MLANRLQAGSNLDFQGACGLLSMVVLFVIAAFPLLSSRATVLLLDRWKAVTL